ncbi:hypothetical protein ACWKWU_01180 [Chitinophaga lutea]
MKTGLLFKLACLCIAYVVLFVHFTRKYMRNRMAKVRAASQG